jgi:AbrB family looped-hinge helix DNA binding protein
MHDGVGQVTIPKAVRDQMGLAAGDTIFFYVSPDQMHALVEKVPDFRDLAGVLSKFDDPDDPDLSRAIKLAKDRAIVGRDRRTAEDVAKNADDRAA